jgi:hypothetical protein
LVFGGLLVFLEFLGLRF